MLLKLVQTLGIKYDLNHGNFLVRSGKNDAKRKENCSINKTPQRLLWRFVYVFNVYKASKIASGSARSL